MRALVTGASGFVGRYLCAHLVDEGDDVATIDVVSERAGEGIDITDPGAVERAFVAASPDTVYHLAARSHVGETWSERDALTAVNVVGTRHVLDACRAVGVRRVVVVGSAEEYAPLGPGEPPLREDAPLRPVTPYGASKLAAEQLALDAHRVHGTPVVCLRAFNHTGPGQPETFLVPGIASRVAVAERDSLGHVAIGNGSSVRDFSDVRDVVRAYRLLAQLGVAGEVYNVASGQGVRVEDLARRLLAQSTHALELRVDQRDLTRPVDPSVLVGDPDKLVAATGWSPELTLDRTLADVLEHARRAGRERP
jgi:GDP-4-dehydro-6-deoxy-D-mannose reductase